jgi:hypothetical protein
MAWHCDLEQKRDGTEKGVYAKPHSARPESSIRLGYQERRF